METIKASVYKHREYAVYVHRMKYYLAVKDEIWTLTNSWIELENTTSSEISQTH